MSRTLDTQKLIRPSHFAHIVLRVRDITQSVDWYQKVLGVETVFGNDFVCFMTYDDEHHRIAFVQTPVTGSAPAHAPGVDHFAYSLDSLGDLLATYRRLEAQGIKPAVTINHGPTTSMYYDDPDGNRMEFQTDNFETEADLKGFLKSEAFAKNPIGVEFDADKLIARYEQGDPIEELVKQGSA